MGGFFKDLMDVNTTSTSSPFSLFGLKDFSKISLNQHCDRWGSGCDQFFASIVSSRLAVFFCYKGFLFYVYTVPLNFNSFIFSPCIPMLYICAKPWKLLWSKTHTEIRNLPNSNTKLRECGRGQNVITLWNYLACFFWIWITCLQKVHRGHPRAVVLYLVWLGQSWYSPL